MSRTVRREFRTFPSREAWLDARVNNIGASTLADYKITGEHARPLPTGIPALESALTFGSDWEPYVAQLAAQRLGLAFAPKNTPLEQLDDEQMSWHDDSFYTVLDGKVHASLDAAANIKGVATIIEIKTSSATRFEFVSQQLQLRYLAQAEMEAFISGAGKYRIVFAHRPNGWQDMSADDISWQLSETLLIGEPQDVTMTMDDLKALYDDYMSTLDGDTVQYSQLLDNILDWEEKAKDGRKQLAQQLEDHPDMTVSARGKIAVLKESKRVLTDWKRLVEDYHVADLTPYRTEKTAMSLSITKEKR
jgi:hypothetical protein